MMTTFIVCLIIVAANVALLAYDKHKKDHKLDKKKPATFVYLRENNAFVRKKLRDLGFYVCPCALSYRNIYLYACIDRSIICGFNESSMHLIKDAKKNGMNIVDCAKNLNVFVEELKKLDL